MPYIYWIVRAKLIYLLGLLVKTTRKPNGYTIPRDRGAW